MSRVCVFVCTWLCVFVFVNLCLCAVRMCVFSVCVSVLDSKKGCGPSYYCNVEVRETLVGYHSIS